MRNPFFFFLLSLFPIILLAGAATGIDIRVHNDKDDQTAGSRHHLLASNYHPNDHSTSSQPATTPNDPNTTLTTPQGNRGIMARAFVNEHNKVRAQLDLPPLVWDNTVARYAQQWALKSASTVCVMKHSMGPYGENLFWGSGNQRTPADAVKLWVSEGPDYDIKSNECAPGKVCGHYTQVVWKESVRLGCDLVECPAGDVFITCNYDPPGNYIGERPF